GSGVGCGKDEREPLGPACQPRDAPYRDVRADDNGQVGGRSDERNGDERKGDQCEAHEHDRPPHDRELALEGLATWGQSCCLGELSGGWPVSATPSERASERAESRRICRGELQRSTRGGFRGGQIPERDRHGCARVPTEGVLGAEPDGLL